MDFVSFTRQKLLSFLREVARLKSTDFHHSAAEECLDILEGMFWQHLSEIDSAPVQRDAALARRASIDANVDILQFQKLLGFLLRSTNVRNPFELYDPIDRLAKRWLGNDARLVLSSEWEFSPFTYPGTFRELPTFAFIGLPATEADNVLIFPLAGHELGHSVWNVHELSDTLSIPVKDAILNCLKDEWVRFKELVNYQGNANSLEEDRGLRDIWVIPFACSMNQCEEVFCDFVGIKTFGTSFLHAFEYLVAPSFGPSRLERYPPLDARVEYMLRAMAHFGLSAPTDYNARFLEPAMPSGSDVDTFLMQVSQRATEAVVHELLQTVTTLADAHGIPLPAADADMVVSSLARLRPAQDAPSLADIVGAGWMALLNPELLPDTVIPADRRFEVINELLCKSIEVFEYERKLEDATQREFNS